LTVVCPLDPAAAERLRHELALLLEDAVAGGASLGFLLPLERAEALAYWASVAEALRAGRRLLLVALADERVIGAVQLDLETRANGRHRAEVMKLMVLRAYRRRGVGRELMSAVFALARAAGRSLLLLDVRTGDPAEALYRSLGFVKFGEVPRYAGSPEGGLAASSFYYLELHPAT
jgi:ribosomal protein S18 acetylase RimI-like enzyme